MLIFTYPTNMFESLQICLHKQVVTNQYMYFSKCTNASFYNTTVIKNQNFQLLLKVINICGYFIETINIFVDTLCLHAYPNSSILHSKRY